MWPEVNEYLDPVTTSISNTLTSLGPWQKLGYHYHPRLRPTRCFLRPKIKWLNLSCNLPRSMLV